MRVGSLLSIGAAALLAACAASATGQRPAATPAAATAVRATSGDELPAGAGKAILDASCTSCHGLNEVTKFRGFYDRRQWRDIVVTMVEYGAALKPDEIEVLATYLVENLGKAGSSTSSRP